MVRLTPGRHLFDGNSSNRQPRPAGSGRRPLAGLLIHFCFQWVIPFYSKPKKSVFVLFLVPKFLKSTQSFRTTQKIVKKFGNRPS